MSQPPSHGSKAQYRAPGTAQARGGSRPGTQGTFPPGTFAGSRGTLTPLTEDGSLALGKTNEPRDRFENPEDPTTRTSITRINNYLAKTQIEVSFNNLCKLLLKMPNLPYNPYPGFARRIRTSAEEHHMFQKSEDEILRIMNIDNIAEPEAPIQESHQIAYIVRPLQCNFVWGTKGIVQLVDPAKIKQFEWLFQDISPTKDRLQYDPNYSNQVMSAIVGPSVFLGPLFYTTHTLHIRHEYLITGPNVKTGVEMFVNSVIKDLKYIETEGTHILLGVNVPTQDFNNEDNWYLQMWTYEAIEDKSPEFWQSLADAVTGNKYIYAECLFSIDVHGTGFQKGQKQYGLNFIQIATEGGQEEGLSYFTEYPLLTAHDGVFMSQAQAEAYLSMFTPRIDLIDKDFGSRLTLNNGDNPGQNSRGSQRSLASQTSTQTGGTSAVIGPYRKTKKQPKVRVDGFQIAQRAGYHPTAWQVTAPIKGGWQKRIVGYHPHAELYEIIYYILLLVIMDRESFGDQILVEIYRLLNSTGHRVYQLMQINKTIRELVLKFEGNATSPLVMDLFVQYKQALIHMLDHEHQERSSDMVTACRTIIQTLDDLANSSEGFTDSVPLNRKTLETLKNINSYTYPLLLGLVEDAMIQCPNMQNLLDNLRETFPENIPQPKTRDRNRPDRTTGVRGGVPSAFYKHGAEEEAILKHDEQVLNLQMCIERDRAPKSIAVESVLIRYIIDTHLDEVWPTFLVDLMSGTKLPPNPYPRFVTCLRQNAQRMDLCFAQQSKLHKKLVHGAERIEDKVNYIYHIPGCDAHGVKSAMMALDSTMFFRLSPLIQQFVQTKFVQRQGPYRVAICCALGGSSVIHGRMDPYLSSLELNEHCFIRGPDACWVEGAQLYSKLVFSHCMELHRLKKYAIAGLYMGYEKHRWQMDEIKARKKAFASEFERYISLKEPIFIRIYVIVEWRMIPIEKHFKFHYVDDEELNFDIYYPEKPMELYQNVFLSKEKAAFYFQYGGTPDRSDPFRHGYQQHALNMLDRDILKARDRQDWINVHRMLYWRNLMKQGTSLVNEVWRMLHSAAGQIDYLISLGRSLQDLVQYCMDEEDRTQGGTIDPDRDSVSNNLNQQDALTVDRVEAMLGRMAQAYKQKLQKVCKLHCALTPKSLFSVVESKFKKITERDPGTRDLFMICDVKTIFTIDEINNMLKSAQDAVGYDVHCISPEAQAMLKSIEVEQSVRPHSVASMHLEDPDIYMTLPQAIQPDHVNQWHSM